MKGSPRSNSGIALLLVLPVLAILLHYRALDAIQDAYVGCYTGGDWSEGTIFTYLTVEACQRGCDRAGNTYAVLWDPDDCRCAQTLEGALESTGCTTSGLSCTGDSSQTCGGSGGESVYLAGPDYTSCDNNGGCSYWGTCVYPTSDYSVCECNSGYSSSSYDCTTSEPTAAPSTTYTYNPTSPAAAPSRTYTYNPTSPAAAPSTTYTSNPTSPTYTYTPTSPTRVPTHSPTNPVASSGGGGSNGAAIGGAVAGTLGGLFLLAGVAFCIYKQKRRTRTPSAQPAAPASAPRDAERDAELGGGGNKEGIPVAAEAGLHVKQVRLEIGRAVVGEQPGPAGTAPAFDPLDPSRQERALAAGAVIAAGAGVAAVAVIGGTYGVAKYIPWVSSVVGLLKDVVDLFDTVQDNRNNCREIVQWAQGMNEVLESIIQQNQEHDTSPNAQPLMAQAQSSLEELIKVAQDYNSAHALKQYAVSGICQKAFATADNNLRRALAALNLSLTQDVLSTVHQIELQVDDRHNHVMRCLAQQQALLEGIRQGQLGQQQGLGGQSPADAVEEALRRLQIMPEAVSVMPVPIGQGSFAKVFPCDYQGALRAAKVVNLGDCTSTDQANEVYKRFARELYIMSTLKSSKVVKVFGAITEPHQLTIIMELGERGSLRGVLDDPTVSDPMTPVIRHMILKDIAAGMVYLYSKGVQHRDLKSLNVLIMHDWHAKISDFGLSKTRQSLDTITTGTEFRGGTWAWKAPELLDGSADFSEKSDVYSYGVIMWEVVCGGATRPWHGLDHLNLMNAVRQGNRLLIDRKCAPEYRAIMEGAWKAPADRPTFSVVCADLRASRLAVDQAP